MLSHRARVAWQRREQAIDDVLLFIEPAIARARASKHADPELKALIRGSLESVRQELIHLRNSPDQPTLPRYEDEFSGGASPAKDAADFEETGSVR